MASLTGVFPRMPSFSFGFILTISCSIERNLMFWICIIILVGIHSSHFKLVAWVFSFRRAFPLAVTAPWETVTVLRKGRSGSPLFALRGRSRQPLIRIEQPLCNLTNHEKSVFYYCLFFRGVGAASSHRLLLHSKCSLKRSSSSSRVNAIRWLSYEICSVVYWMQFYRMSLYLSNDSWSACLWCFCVLWCVWVRVEVCMCGESAAACQPYVSQILSCFVFFFLFLFFPDDKTAFPIYHVSNLDA